MNSGDDMKVMFVCAGNTCRSPMAEAIFRNMVDDVEVCSAGINASDGEPASYLAVEVCSNHDLDLSKHESCSISNSGIREMDLILTAEVSHRDILRNSYPELKICTVKQYGEGYDDLDIADPYGISKIRYENCFSEIEEALKKVADKFVNEE